MRHRGRRRARTRPTGGSCGSGTSTASCTSTTSASPWACRPEPVADHQGSCLEEVATGLGYIVGRRAGPARRFGGWPDPAHRRAGGSTYLVRVDGRASVVDALDGPVTVGIELPVPLFLRLAGGRDDGSNPAGEEITFSGDRALGEQLVANLAFTI